MGTERVQIVGWFVGVVMPVEQIFFCLGCLVGPVQNIFLLTVHYSYVSITQQAGQAAVLGRLSLSMCLWAFQRVIQNRSSELFNFLQPWEWYSLKINSAAQAMVSLLTGQELHSCELLAITATALLVTCIKRVQPTVITDNILGRLGHYSR
jgi:hypothetical protein